MSGRTAQTRKEEGPAVMAAPLRALPPLGCKPDPWGMLCLLTPELLFVLKMLAVQTDTAFRVELSGVGTRKAVVKRTVLWER